MEPLRTLLFVPGNRSNMIEKARPLPADVLVLDLEDSVPLAEKGAARALVKDSLPGLALEHQKVFVRINSIVTGLAEEDLEAVVSEGLDGITIPKAESAADVGQVEQIIQSLEKERGLGQGSIQLIPWIETAKGLVRIVEIAGSSLRLVGIAFGADDYTRDMGIERTKEATEQFYVRSAIAVAARAADVMALDTPWVDFRDEEGLVRDAKLARQLGFQGKFLIHPSQIEPVNQIFQPSAEEVANARRVVEAFEEAEAKGSASTSLDGRMIDIAVVRRARNVISLAEAIAKKATR